MTAPMRPPRVLQGYGSGATAPADPPQTENERALLASEERRLTSIQTQKLEDALESEAKTMLALHCEKISDRVNRFKAISMFLAVKHKLGPMFGGALDGDGDEP